MPVSPEIAALRVTADTLETAFQHAWVSRAGLERIAHLLGDIDLARDPDLRDAIRQASRLVEKIEGEMHRRLCSVRLQVRDEEANEAAQELSQVA